MKKLRFILLVMMIGMLTSGCTDRSAQGENEASAGGSEYALLIGNDSYTVSEEPVETIPWQDGEVTERPGEALFPASRHYVKEHLSLLSFLIDDERRHGEQIYSILTSKEGRTPRGIGIGDHLDVLRKAYPELIYFNAAYGNGSELAEYTRMYSFRPEDGSNYYINFYLKDKKVSMIEIANSLDEPRNWYVPEPILGQDNLFCEVLSDQPGQSHVQYFYLKENGEEEILLDIMNAWPESVDLDGDGVTEIVVQYTEQNQYTNVGIYRMSGAELTYIDVNQTVEAEGMKALHSRYRESAANESSEAPYYIAVSGELKDGRKEDVKYILKAGKLVIENQGKDGL